MAIGYRSVLASSGGGGSEYTYSIGGTPQDSVLGRINDGTAGQYPSDIVIGDKVRGLNNTFQQQLFFNVNVTLGKNVKFIRGTFQQCSNYNKPFTFTQNLEDISYAFSYCSNFNQPITLGENVYNVASAFFYCNSLNQPIVLGNNMDNCQSMFSNCRALNQSITFETNRTSGGRTCSYALENCIVLNKPITVKNFISTYGMFRNCKNFNSTVSVTTSSLDMAYMFEGCDVFNQSFTIPTGTSQAFDAFKNCLKFNRSLTVPKSCSNVANMLYGCTDFGNTVYLNNNAITAYGVRNLFAKCNNSKRKTVYCNNITNLQWTNTSSIVGAAVTWSSTTNGVYNSVYNVYILKNYSGST